MSKIFKTKNFLITEGVIIALIIFTLPLLRGLFSILEKIFGTDGVFGTDGIFSICIDVGPSPEFGDSGLPCFVSDGYLFYALILAILFITYFFAFIIHKFKNKNA